MISVSMLEKLYQKYDRPCFTVDDFEEDAMRIVFVSRLLLRYHRNKNVNIRLLLNHIVVLRNVFGSLFIDAIQEEITIDTAIYFDTVLKFMRIQDCEMYCPELMKELENVTVE